MLIVSAHPPLQQSKEAGQKVFFEFMQLMSSFYELHLISVVREEEYAWGLADSLQALGCAQVQLIPISKLRKLYSLARYPLRAVHYNTKASSAIVHVLRQWMGSVPYERIHFEWEQMVQYVDEAQRLKAPGALLTLTCHDVLHQMYERKAGKDQHQRFYKVQLALCKRNERRWFPKLDTVITLNEKDRLLVEQLQTGCATQVIRPFYTTIEAASQSEKHYELVFFGAMNRMENEDAVWWFLQRIYPQIAGVYPSIRLKIIGNRPSDDLLKHAERVAGLEVTGYVEDPYALIAASRIGIVPLRLGAGIKIKLLECMACGIPVVSTEVGAEGTDFTEQDGLYVCGSEEQFAEAILRLLHHPELAACQGERSRLAVQAAYSYEEYRRRLLQAFQLLEVTRRDSTIKAMPSGV